MWDDVVLDRPPIDVYITYSVYWGTIRWIVKMKDFKGGMGRAKSSLDRPWNPGTTKGRFDSIVTGPGWTVSLLFDNPGLGQVLFAHLMYEKHFFQKNKTIFLKKCFYF